MSIERPFCQNLSIYIPHCIIINTIDTLTDPIHCYNNIPISFQYQNISKLAFLQSSRNISDIDNEIACENTSKI